MSLDPTGRHPAQDLIDKYKAEAVKARTGPMFSGVAVGSIDVNVPTYTPPTNIGFTLDPWQSVIADLERHRDKVNKVIDHLKELRWHVAAVPVAPPREAAGE